MQKRILLHIGRHKTGTTSLQAFFTRNRERLLEQGIYYPQTGIRNGGHHLVAEPFPMRRLNQLRARYSPEQHELVQALRDEIDSAPADTILISSEAFQNMGPKYAQRIFAGYQVEVVLYLRDQLSYFVSSYAQEVHADNTMVDTVEDYYLKVFSGAVNYLEFLDNWHAVFPGQMQVRLFERESMHRQNVVDDFCWHFLGLDISEGYQLAEASNPSIRGDLIEYKRILNQLLPSSLERRTVNWLYSQLPTFNENFAKSQLFITPTVIKLLAIDIGRSNRKLARRYLQGEQLDRRIRANAEKYARQAELSAETLMSLYQQLLPLVKGLADALPAAEVAARAPALLQDQMRWQKRRSTISLWRRYRMLGRRLRRAFG